MVLMLSRDDVRQVLDMDAAIEVVTRAHIAQARGEVVMPVRLTMRFDDRPSELEAMPAYIQSLPALGMKMIDFVGTNAARGLPSIYALIVLLDPDDGRPLAIMDASYITAVRTAAASAMATTLLAREDARVLGIIGTGVQARSHLAALVRVRPIEQVLVAGRTLERATTFVAESRSTYPEIDFRAVASARDAAAEADVIATTTTSSTPILHWADLRPGTHLNAIGSHSPDTRELAGDVIANARLFVDSRGAILKESGDILMAIDERLFSAERVDCEIGEVAAGIKPARKTDSEVTLYKSGGIALQDISTAHLVHERARSCGIGIEIDLWGRN